MSLPRQSDEDKLNQTSVSQFNSSKRLLLTNGRAEQNLAESSVALELSKNLQQQPRHNF